MAPRSLAPSRSSSSPRTRSLRSGTFACKLPFSAIPTPPSARPLTCATKLPRKRSPLPTGWPLNAAARVLPFFATAPRTARFCGPVLTPVPVPNAVSRSSCKGAVRVAPPAATVFARYESLFESYNSLKGAPRMTFYSLSDSTFTRHYREEVDMAFSTLDCVLNGEKSLYCSTELTTGFRLYNAMRSSHLKTVAELKELKGKDWYTDNIWNANLKACAEFASSVRAQLQSKTLVVTP